MPDDMSAERVEQKPAIASEVEQARQSIEQLVTITKPLFEKIEGNENAREQTGWSAWWRKPRHDYEWSTIYAGITGVKQDKVMRGRNRESLSLDMRYQPSDEDFKPDHFSISGGTEMSPFSLDYDREFQSVRARYATDKQLYFFDISKRKGITVRVVPNLFRQLAIFFEDVSFETGSEGIIKLGRVQ